jgi:3-oxoacyl-[acyl-carrier protein] reductase
MSDDVSIGLYVAGHLRKEISMSQQKLAGKVALVTGASKGIGAGIAKELAAQGAAVVVNYASSEQDAAKVVAEIIVAGGKAVAVQGSVAVAADVERMFAAARTVYGRLDILVNNAGVYAFGPLETVTVEGVRAMFDVNVTGLLLASQAAAAMFPAEGGSIVNIGSIVGELPPGGAAVYASTKGAVNTITRSLAKELGPRQIRVNAVNPGATATEGFASAGLHGDFSQSIIGVTPLGRLGEPADIAKAVSFLASDEAGWITGSLLDAAGGWR